MIPLHGLRAKSKNRTRGQFECDVTWFCCSFDFVRLHALYHLERGEGSFEIGQPWCREWKNFKLRWIGKGS